VLAAVGLFSFVLSDDADTPVESTPVEQAAPQPSAQPVQPPPPVSGTQPQQAAEVAPTPEATPAAAQRRAPASPAKNERREAAPVEVAEPIAPVTPGLPPEAAADPILRGRDLRANPLTDDEMREVIRRAAGDRRRARLIRQRILEEQRRRNRQEPRPRGVDVSPPAPPRP
jgi:hypothetical protein